MPLFRRNREPAATVEPTASARPRRRPSARGTIEALTAAGAKVGGKDGAKVSLKTEPWQKTAWDYYDLVGEEWYAANFYGGCFSQVKLKIGLRDPEGNIVDAFGDEIVDETTGEGTGVREALHPLAQEAADLIGSLRSRIGGQATLMKLMGINVSVAGEFNVLGTDNAVGDREWEVLSTEELRTDPSNRDAEGNAKLLRVDDDNPQGAPIEGEHFVCRVWNPHPRRSKRADSAMKAQLEVLEELLLLTRAVKSTTTSRLSGPGILFYDSRIDYQDDEEAPEDGEKGDKFAQDVITAAQTAIADRASAAAVVPFVVPVEPPQGLTVKDMVVQVDFRSNFEGYPSIALREEAVKRFAQGIDLPVEIITGQGAANHWGSWMIDESMFKQHFEPKLLVVCDGLTTGFLHPLLKAGSTGRSDADVFELVVWYDASELVVHPNRGADATVGYGLELVAGRVWRRENGFSEEDAPDEAELQWRADRRQTMAPQPAPNDGPEQGSDEVQPGAPEQDAAALLRYRLAAAAEVAIERALDRAGARVRSKANGHQHVHAAIASAANADVPALLGPEQVRTLMGDDGLLRPGEFEAYARVAAAWATDAGLPAPGMFGVEAARTVERLTGERLFRRFDVRPEMFATLTARDLEAVGI